MKKITAIFLAFVLALVFTACSGAKEEETTAPLTTQPTSSAEPESENNNDFENGKILVAYFSATNNTEAAAKNIADYLNCDIYEITPQSAYTADDLNYHDSDSRTSIEMNDETARPAILGSVDNMEQYDVIFLGYPIWWNDAPRIMNTFLESYDFSGKTIIPFCTSGGSDISASASNLKAAYSNAQWLDGKRFSGGTSQSEIEEWFNSLNLK